VPKFICGLPLTGQAAFLYPKSFLSPQSGRKEILFMNNNTIILGIDHGYGNIKTAHTCFPTGVTTHEKEPTFHNDLLIYDGHFYTIGEGHKEFTADKMMDDDYYVLTLAAIAKELSLRRLIAAKVYLAVVLPLTWVSEQKDSFRAYLLHNESVDFTYQDTDYHVEFAGADIYPQGFAAVAANLRAFPGTNMLCDIGNGTEYHVYQRVPARPEQLLHGEIRHPPVYAGCPGEHSAAVWQDAE